MPKHEVDWIAGIGLTPPHTVATLDAGKGAQFESRDPIYSGASLYVDLDSVGPALALDVVRVDLVSELNGIRQRLATAFFQPPSAGVVVPADKLLTVTGVYADAFHAVARSTSPDINFKVRLASRYCCGGYAAHVPEPIASIPSAVRAALTQEQLDALLEGLPSSFGSYRVIGEPAAAQVSHVWAAPGASLRRMHVVASPLQDTVVTATPLGGAPASYVVNRGTESTIEPLGALVVEAITIDNFAAATIEVLEP